MSFKTAKHISRPIIYSYNRLISQVILVDETIGLDQGAECEGDIEYRQGLRQPEKVRVNQDVLTSLDICRTAALGAPGVENLQKLCSSTEEI